MYMVSYASPTRAASRLTVNLVDQLFSLLLPATVRRTTSDEELRERDQGDQSLVAVRDGLL